MHVFMCVSMCVYVCLCVFTCMCMCMCVMKPEMRPETGGEIRRREKEEGKKRINECMGSENNGYCRMEGSQKERPRMS